MSEDNASFLRDRVRDLERENKDLVKDNGKQRDELREARDAVKNLEGERDDLKTKLPPEGSVTLSKADSERWRTLSAKAGELGGVDKVLERLGRVDELEAKDAKREREDGIKDIGLKTAIFELVAEGKPYRVEGDGDDRKVYLTVDDKERELSEVATERGLSDLLGVMGLSSDASTKNPAPPTPTGPGTRPPVKRAPVDENAEYETKKSNPAYRG